MPTPKRNCDRVLPIGRSFPKNSSLVQNQSTKELPSTMPENVALQPVLPSFDPHFGLLDRDALAGHRDHLAAADHER